LEYPANDRASSPGEGIPARGDLATVESPRGHQRGRSPLHSPAPPLAGSRDRVLGADILGEFAFEAFGLGAGGNPSGAQGVEYLALLVGSDGRTMKSYLSHCV